MANSGVFRWGSVIGSDAIEAPRRYPGPGPLNDVPFVNPPKLPVLRKTAKGTRFTDADLAALSAPGPTHVKSLSVEKEPKPEEYDGIDVVSYSDRQPSFDIYGFVYDDDDSYGFAYEIKFACKFWREGIVGLTSEIAHELTGKVIFVLMGNFTDDMVHAYISGVTFDRYAAVQRLTILKFDEGFRIQYEDGDTVNVYERDGVLCTRSSDCVDHTHSSDIYDCPILYFKPTV